MDSNWQNIVREFGRVLQTDKPMHDAVVRLLNALSEGEEIQNIRRASRVPGGARRVKPYRHDMESIFRGEKEQDVRGHEGVPQKVQKVPKGRGTEEEASETERYECPEGPKDSP